jgi:hypothetical protein
MRKFWHDHSLGIVLVALFAAHVASTLYFGWDVYVAEAKTHQEPAVRHEFFTWWFYEFHQSLVADVYGAMILVFLSKWFREKYSAESN